MSEHIRIAYLIIAHRYPDQLARMLGRLYYPNCRFYLHIDRHCEIEPFASACRAIVPAHSFVILPKRRHVLWGNIDLSLATLEGFQQILDSDEPLPDFIIVLSGQDYPLVPNANILAFLDKNFERNFVHHVEVTPADTELIDRITKYWFLFEDKRTKCYPSSDATTLKDRAFQLALCLMPNFPLPRKIPLGLKLYFGSNWLRLKPDAAAYLVQFVKRHPEVIDFFRYVYVPEEMLFQTILLNAPDDKLRASIENSVFTYLHWDRPLEAYPYPLTVADYPALISSGRFFGRKFDATADSEVLDLIDAQIEATTASN